MGRFHSEYLKSIPEFQPHPEYRSPEWDAYFEDGGGYSIRQKWLAENDPEKSFQAKHNMVKIEYTELWRDS